MRSLAFTDDPTLLYNKSQCGLGQYALDEGKIHGRGTQQNAAERKVKGLWTGRFQLFSCQWSEDGAIGELRGTAEEFA